MTKTSQFELKEKLSFSEELFPIFYSKRMNEIDKDLTVSVPFDKSIAINILELEKTKDKEEIAEIVGKKLFGVMSEVRRQRNLVDLYNAGVLKDKPVIKKYVVQIMPLENLYKYIDGEGIASFLNFMLEYGTKSGHYFVCINNGEAEHIPENLYDQFKTVVSKKGLKENDFLRTLGDTEEVSDLIKELGEEESQNTFIVKHNK
jgi:hypothetical protein